MGNIIETERLLLRPFLGEDGAAYAAIRAQPGVTRFLPSHTEDQHIATERAIATVRVFQDCWQRDGYGPWAVEHRGHLIGHLGLRRLPEMSGVTELLFLLDPAYQSRGFATEGARAALTWGWEDLGLTQIEAFAMPDNIASCRVLERIGMSRKPDLVEAFGIKVVHFIAQPQRR